MDHLNIKPESGPPVYVNQAGFVRVCQTSEALVGVIRASALSVALSDDPLTIVYSSSVPANIAPIRLEPQRVSILLPSLPEGATSSSNVDLSQVKDVAPLLNEPELNPVKLHIPVENEPIASALAPTPAEPIVPSYWESFLSTGQLVLSSASTAVISVFNVASTVISLENTHSFRTLDTWLTTVAPALNQLKPEYFESTLQTMETLKNPLNPFQLHEVSRRGAVNRSLERRMNMHCPLPAPLVIAPADVPMVNAASAAVTVGNSVLKKAGQVHHLVDSANRAWGAAKTTMAGFAPNALSREDTKKLANDCTTALMKAMQESLKHVQDEQGKGANAAHFLGTSTTIRALSYLGEAALSNIIEGALLQMNSAVNATFTQSRVMGPLGRMITHVMIDNVPMPEGSLETVQQLTALMPQIKDEAQRAMLDMVFLQYVKHIMVLQNALTKNGTIDFNTLLASRAAQGDPATLSYKPATGDPAVAESFTALCALMSRGNPALTAKIEEGLRNAFAVGQLAIHAQSDRNMLITDLAEAAKQDGWISNDSNRYAQESVARITDGVLAWWAEPPGPQVQQFKQLVRDGAAEASQVGIQASSSHVGEALAEAMKRGTDVSRWNRAAAVGVQVADVSLNYYLSGKMIGSLMTAGATIAGTEAILHTKNKAIDFAVGKARPDDKVATAVAQFCVFSNHLVEGMRR